MTLVAVAACGATVAVVPEESVEVLSPDVDFDVDVVSLPAEAPDLPRERGGASVLEALDAPELSAAGGGADAL